MLHKVWSGAVRYVALGRLAAQDGKFLVHDVGVDDTLSLRLPGEMSDPVSIKAIRAHTNDVLEVAQIPDVEPSDEQVFELTIERNILHGKCMECAQQGLVREGFKPGTIDGKLTLLPTHRHCQWNGSILPDGYIGNYSDDARTMMEQMLLATGQARLSFPIARGKKTVRMHVLTFAENDAVREWQDDFLRKNKDASDVVYFEQQTRAHLALALDDDGNGKSPALALANVDVNKFSIFQQLLLRMAHFGQYPDAFYRKLTDISARIDGLAEEVCAQRIDDDISEDDLLQLGEDLVHSEPVLQAIKVFGGRSELYFTAVNKDVIDAADKWAESIITQIRKEQGGDVLTVRENELRSIARFAAEFRGDARVSFDESSTFDERLGYLTELCHPLWNMYLHAGNVWRQRAHRAMGVDTLGKS